MNFNLKFFLTIVRHSCIRGLILFLATNSRIVLFWRS
ncbi:MAG: hypothetical protein PWR20_2514, partial [Bacteroidales bacterium]|nr:hypothetical protein [Bacteroidales bacterium]